MSLSLKKLKLVMSNNTTQTSICWQKQGEPTAEECTGFSLQRKITQNHFFKQQE